MKQAPILRVVPEPSQAPQEETEESVLLRWSDLCESQKIYVIRSWVSGEWRTLSQFCTVNSLNLNSIRSTFNRYGIERPDAGRRETGIEEVNKLEKVNSMLCDSALGMVRLTDNITQQLAVKLARSNLTISELKSLLSRVTSDSTKVGYLISAVNAAIAVKQGSTSPGEAKRVSVPIPPEVQQALQGRLSKMGEDMVRLEEARGA